MAYLRVDDWLVLGVNSPVTATDWQVATDEEFTDIIDESIEDTVNLFYWNTPLKISDRNYHSDTANLYARFRFHFGSDSVGEWLRLNDGHQNQ